MSTKDAIKVSLLKQSELEEAHRIVRLAFGTFLGMPDPLEFMGDRNLVAPRFRSTHVKVLAARDNGRLIGTNVVTNWGMQRLRAEGFNRPDAYVIDDWR